MTLKIAPTLDGRRQRSERSQVAIVEAALTLINEEKQVPTAQQIADRAGVSIRSFFRHFADMDALFLSADEMLGASYETLFAVTDRSGTLSQRISRAVDLYGNAFDQLCDLILCTQALAWRFPALQERYAYHQKRLRDELELWLPEVAISPRSRREAVHAVTSFEMWHRLRTHQRLSQKSSHAIIQELVTGLLAAC
jgi:AcrR family transcriptional regulator